MRILFLVFLLFGGISGIIFPNNPNFQYVGRFDTSNPQSFRMDWSGVQIAASFQGTSLTVHLVDETKNVNQSGFNVFVDGKLKVLSLIFGQSSYTIATNLQNSIHSLLITKRTEPLFSVSRFNGITLDSGKTLVPLPNRPMRRIEFIGDSITCGYGDEGKYPCPFTAATENNLRTYGPLTAAALSADYYLEAWSGKGVVRNWGDQNITSIDPFPSYFPRTIANDPNTSWNFMWKPDAVVINLGTNDYSTQPSPPANIFENGYSNFLKLIRSKYGEIPIFLVCGPVIENPCCQYIQSIVAMETNCHYIDMQNILTFPNDYGCDSHPNVIGHMKMANISIPAIKKVMGW